MGLPQTTVEKQYPVLYWMTLVYLIGIPNFIHFDVTGRTHSQGTFNLTSISQIAIALLSAYVLAMTSLLNRLPLLCRKIELALWLWIPLLLQLVLSTMLQPSSRLTPYSPTDKIISLYRLAEWIIAFSLLVALYTRSPVKQSAVLIGQLIGRFSWAWMMIVWVVLPIMPSQAYGASDELASAVSQLGGQLIAPSYLATLAIAAFFYALFFFPKGLYRTMGCLLATVTIFLAHTRIEQLSFMLLLIIYCTFFSTRLMRLITISFAVVVIPVVLVLRDTLMQYFSRGQAMKTLTTLNDRTLVWAAGIEAIKERPLIGYGFLAGAKNAIRDHWIYMNWTPPHAHNEFIQAMLSGGLLALLLVVAIYARTLWVALRAASKSRESTLLLFLMILFVVRAIGGSNFTIAYTRVGALFLLTFIGITAGAKDAVLANLRTFQTSREHSVHEVSA